MKRTIKIALAVLMFALCAGMLAGYGDGEAQSAGKHILNGDIAALLQSIEWAMIPIQA